MMAAIRTGLETAMGVAVSRPMARGKLVDLILIVGAAALVIATAGMAALGEFVQRRRGQQHVAGVLLRLATVPRLDRRDPACLPLRAGARTAASGTASSARSSPRSCSRRSRSRPA